MPNLKSFLVLFILMLPILGIQATSLSAFPPTDSLPNGIDQMKLEHIDRKLAKSPHYKNPNAAGRLAIFNRTTTNTTPAKREQLTGPAYKNRKRTVVLTGSMGPSASTKRKLTGPRYKNRGAKSSRYH